MIKRKILITAFSALFLLTLNTQAQEYIAPVTIPQLLSANFGELRNNHFHSGLDYTTQGAVNKPIVAVADGYISRINVSPGGYGLALYIEHPATGQTSVYGHLNSFSRKISEYFVAKQYEAESYRLDISLEPNEITVKKGEQIALSGNTGSSGGPHLHFELRDTKSEEPLDVLEYISRGIRDNLNPDLRGIAVYPVEGQGIVNGSQKPLRMNIAKNKNGNYNAPPQTINAWGKIGLGVKAYDRMNGRNNIYGVKQVRLFVDEVMVYESIIRRFSFDKTRMLNTFIDFEDWRINRSFFMRSFIEPGNTLDFYKTINDGYINIVTEKPYRIRYELTDHHGNTTRYAFVINGKKQAITTSEKCANFMAWNLSNSYVESDISLTIPMGNLYNNICYRHSRTASDRYYSDIHRVHNSPVPLHRNGQLRIKLNCHADVDESKYGVVKIARNGSTSWQGGNYKEGYMELNINELGDRYAVDTDTEPPQILPQAPANWAARKRIVIALKDNKSGIAHFRGEINGEFVLFKHDMKSPNYTYTFDDTRLTKGKKQQLLFTATDGAGNRSEYRYEFDY